MWKEIEGFGGRYEVSPFGYVRRKARQTKSGARRVSKPLSRKMVRGYRMIGLSEPGDEGKRIEVMVARLVAHAYIGSPPSPSHVVTYEDGDRTNLFYKNLRWAPKGDTIKNTFTKGSSHPRAKLDEASVSIIKDLLLAGAKRSDLANQFSVSPSTISAIKTGRIWGHLA